MVKICFTIMLLPPWYPWACNVAVEKTPVKAMKSANQNASTAVNLSKIDP